jgi:hypothetical protein
MTAALLANVAVTIVAAAFHLRAGYQGVPAFRLWHVAAGFVSTIYAGAYLAAFAADIDAETWTRWSLPAAVLSWPVIGAAGIVSIDAQRKADR